MSVVHSVYDSDVGFHAVINAIAGILLPTCIIVYNYFLIFRPPISAVEPQIS